MAEFLTRKPAIIAYTIAVLLIHNGEINLGSKLIKKLDAIRCRHVRQIQNPHYRASSVSYTCASARLASERPSLTSAVMSQVERASSSSLVTLPSS